jgi:NAD(P)-dependent dehydrogenase (short-subunit alcohol dehydrogenase family)
MTVANVGAYIASKAALSRMTAVLDAEVRERGVRVFALAPKAEGTAMVDELCTSDALTDAQRQQFRRDAASRPAGERLERSVELFVELLSGRLDDLAGQHLASERWDRDAGG